MAGVRVASDVGGTFTDNIVYDTATRRMTVSKVPTTPANRAVGTVEGLRRALALQGRSGRDVDYVGHGMTTTTNAVIQRSGARTALLCNQGFRDLLLIGRQNRPSLFDIDAVRPAPLVPRELCFTVAGRIDAAGREVRPLDEAALVAIAAAMREKGVEAVAILFLHAYANDTHEQRAKEKLQALLPGVVICASAEIVSEFREYERGMTVVLNAYLRPVMETYLRSLSQMLRDSTEGLGVEADKPIMVIEASGGLMTIESARAKPVHTVLSGPAGGVVASAHLATLAGMPDIITMDIGGTSTDISLIRRGEPAITRSAMLETVPIRLPVIDINAIGAGGGSIAWIDEGGALRVGPMSAEAVPGPACYGRGGTRPTVTDANIVLGRFDSKTKLGGEMTMDLMAAETAIRTHIAEPLGLSLIVAAAGVLRVAHANIVRGIRVVSVERGHDPRDFVLVPFGGAGPMHGTPVARELRIPRLLIPPAPGILCALGQLVSDLRHDVSETYVARYDAIDPAQAIARLEAVRGKAAALLDADRITAERRHISLRVDMRYAGQSYEIPLPLDGATAAAWEALAEQFNAAHRQRFGHADPAAALEVVGFGATAIGRIEAPQLPGLDAGGEAPPADALAGERQVFFEADALDEPGNHHLSRVYRRERLLAGNRITGPAIIEEISASTVLYPGDTALVHPSGSIVVEVGR